MTLPVLASVVIWPVMVVIYILWIIAGWILVPIAVLFRAYAITGVTNHKGDKWSFTWRWMEWLFGNREDGIAEGWQYWHYKKIVWIQIIYWSCLRNPAAGMRWAPIISCKIQPDFVSFRGTFGSYDYDQQSDEIMRVPSWEERVRLYDTRTPQWFFAWQGLYSNFYWQFKLRGKLRRLWIGWKIYPTDIYGITSYRKEGAGFALQFKKA